MALGANYVTLAALKQYLKISDTFDDDELNDALASASRSIEKYCGRQFNDAGSATARVYYPDSWRRVVVDDFHTTTGLVVKTDQGDDGTYETTWSATDYLLEPLNGIVDGETGWPFHRICTTGARWFPVAHYTYLLSYRPSVEVTARWGWAAIPAPVKQACLIIAAETFRLKEAPFGVAGYGEFGVVRVRDNPMAASRLGPYRLAPVMVA